jgi:SAM-dependent methyltransferase
MRGQLIEAEHIVRYRWALGFAPGMRVLDAGCGAGYGAAMLAAAGAASVVGLDRAASVLQEARPRLGDDVELVEGDVEDLPFADGSFDLVVCLETLEHVERPDTAIAELARVAGDAGLVIVSSPNRDVYEPGNPHHVREFTPVELRAALERYFPHVELRRQANLIASCVMPDGVAASNGGAAVAELELAKLVSIPPGAETYTLALASAVAIPRDIRVTAAATGMSEVRRWLELYDEQQAILTRQGARIRELEARERSVQAARQAALEAEQDRARVLSLQQELAASREERAALTARLERSATVISRMQASPSWRLTAPLRRLKSLSSGLRGRGPRP